MKLKVGWQIFFGGVFDKRVGMLFAARRNEDGNVHRRDGVSKTVTKNMRAGFFKNQKIKERPNLSADKAGNAPFRGKNITADLPDGEARTADRSFRSLILTGMSCFLSALFYRLARLTLKSAFQTARTTRFDVSVLATSGRLVDSAIFLIKNVNLLIINTFCQFFVEKRFELRIEVCDTKQSLSTKVERLCFLDALKACFHTKTKKLRSYMSGASKRLFL